MKKILFITTFCFLFSFSFTSARPLFYETINFAKNDTLNIRTKPHYRSKKIGEIGLGMRLRVKECTQNRKFNWCKITPLHLDHLEGWVNEKFITPTIYQEGYVTINNRQSICDYVLKCQKKGKRPKCLVVTGVTESNNIIVQTEWIDKSRLRAANNFSAADDSILNPEGGYCTHDRAINRYLKREKLKALSQSMKSPSFSTVISLLEALSDKNAQKIQSLIHPRNGVLLSALSYFDRKDSRKFSRQSFITNYKNRRTLNWGRTEARGDSINMSLYRYIRELRSDIPHIGKAIAINNLKNFPQKKGQNLKAYEVYWYMDESNKDYSYSGLVVLLEKFNGRWYVVGITKDYWTP